MSMDTHHINRRLHDAAYQASVRSGQLFVGVGFGIGELIKTTDMRDDFGAMWLPVKMLSAPGEQAWQRMIVGWIASRLLRGLFIVFPSRETISGAPSLLRVCRSVLQVRCPCLVVVPHGLSQAYAWYIPWRSLAPTSGLLRHLYH